LSLGTEAGHNAVPRSQEEAWEAVDVTCIWTDRVYAMGPPTPESVALLNDRFPNRYMVWNLSNEASHRIAPALQGQLCDFHWSAPGKSQNPALHSLFGLCYAIHAWLSLAPTHAAFVFCGNGKTRTGIVVACLLRYCAQVPTALEGERGGEGGRERGRERVQVEGRGFESGWLLNGRSHSCLNHVLFSALGS
jgi:hypothetical protein